MCLFLRLFVVLTAGRFIRWLWFEELVPEFPIGLGSGAALVGEFGLAFPVPLVDPEYQIP